MAHKEVKYLYNNTNQQFNTVASQLLQSLVEADDVDL